MAIEMASGGVTKTYRHYPYDAIYADGRQVRELWLNGTKYYPDEDKLERYWRGSRTCVGYSTAASTVDYEARDITADTMCQWDIRYGRRYRTSSPGSSSTTAPNVYFEQPDAAAAGYTRLSTAKPGLQAGWRSFLADDLYQNDRAQYNRGGWMIPVGVMATYYARVDFGSFSWVRDYLTDGSAALFDALSTGVTIACSRYVFGWYAMYSSTAFASLYDGLLRMGFGYVRIPTNGSYEYYGYDLVLNAYLYFDLEKAATSYYGDRLIFCTRREVYQNYFTQCPLVVSLGSPCLASRMCPSLGSNDGWRASYGSSDHCRALQRTRYPPGRSFGLTSTGMLMPCVCDGNDFYGNALGSTYLSGGTVTETGTEWGSL